MIFTDKQETIIKKIQDGTIYDIYTYIITHKNMEEIQYNKIEIEENKKKYREQIKNNQSKFNSDIDFEKIQSYFNKKTSIVINTNDSENDNQSDINLRDFNIEIELIGQSFIVNTINDCVYYLPNLYRELLDFYQVWNQLEQNNLIFTMDTNLTTQDAKVFLKEKKEQENRYTHLLLNDSEHADFQLTKDDESLFLSTKYLGKKILPLPELKILIENNYKTEEKLQYETARKQSWWAIGISIILGATSLILSNNLSDENTKFWIDNEDNRLDEYQKMNDTLKIISNDLKEFKDISGLDTADRKQIIGDLSEINKTLQEVQKFLTD